MTKTTTQWIGILCLLTGISLPAQTPPTDAATSRAGIISETARNINQIKEEQYIAFNPNYERDRADFIARLHPVAHQLFVAEYAGHDILCASQIYDEILWLISCSADFKSMDQRLRELKVKLDSSPTNAPYLKAGEAPDCYAAWWKRLDWTYENLRRNDPIPADILGRFNTPEKLRQYLVSVSVSDIPQTGMDNWQEFNMALADFIRWVIRDRPGDFCPQLRDALMNMVLQFQDPETGYWGERYEINGRRQFVPDLSTTFHIVSYLRGNVPDMDKIVATTLATKDLDTPVGWLWKGQNYNHNSMDVIVLFKWGWRSADTGRRKAMASAIREMLQRCVAGIQPDGSFKRTDADISIEDATYFGAEFLIDAGYFDKSKRFWTDADFPQAEQTRQRIIGFIEKHRSSGAMGGSVYEEILAGLKVR